MKSLHSIIAVVLGLLFGGLLLALPLGKFAVALAGFTVLLVVLRAPLIGLCLFAFTATLMPYSTLQLGIRFTLSEALLGLTWAGTAWQLFLQRLPRPQWPMAEKSLLLLMAFSALPFVAGHMTIHTPDNGAVNWARWLINLSTLFLVPLLLRERHARESLIVALLLGNLAMLLLSLGIFARHRNAMDMIPILEALHYAHPEALQDIFSAENARLGTPWVHPNLSGGAMALFVPLALFYGLARRGWLRALGLAVAGLGCIALLLSSSRGAILSLGLVLAWLAWLRVPGTRKALAASIVLGGVLALSYPPLQSRLATMFSSDNASTSVRVEEYSRFPEAMARYPLGIGFESEPPVPGSGLIGISNLWLNYVYKLGVPGMLLFCVVLWQWWRCAKPRGKVPAVDSSNALWLGSTSAVVAALLTGLIDHYFSFTMVLVGLFWLVMGLSLQAARELAPTPRPRPLPSRMLPGSS